MDTGSGTFFTVLMLTRKKKLKMLLKPVSNPELLASGSGKNVPDLEAAPAPKLDPTFQAWKSLYFPKFIL